MAVDADEVSQVDQLDQLPLLFGEISLGAHELDLAGPVLNVKEF